MRTIQDYKDTFFKEKSLSACLQGEQGNYRICFSSRDYKELKPFFFIQKIRELYRDLGLIPCIDNNENVWMFANFINVSDDLVLDFIIKFNDYYEKSLDKNEVSIYNY
jgi:hypothetical protein